MASTPPLLLAPRHAGYGRLAFEAEALLIAVGSIAGEQNSPTGGGLTSVGAAGFVPWPFGRGAGGARRDANGGSGVRAGCESVPHEDGSDRALGSPLRVRLTPSAFFALAQVSVVVPLACRSKENMLSPP